jgi:hypothetical protein
MGYQIAFWEGARPADDAAAAEEFRRMAGLYLVQEPVEPTPTIRTFCETLAGIWTTDTTDPAWRMGPWKWPDPLDASGPMLYINLTLRSEHAVVPRIINLAADLGLVIFDLMYGVLRPCPQAVIDAFITDMWRQVLKNRRSYRG